MIIILLRACVELELHSDVCETEFNVGRLRGEMEWGGSVSVL